MIIPIFMKKKGGNLKVSEITVESVASYLRLEVATDPLLVPILATAKKFIESYTGIHDEEVVDAYIGNGKDSGFKLSKFPLIESSVVVEKNGVELTVDIDYTINATKGIVTFVETPLLNDEIDISYNYGLDGFEEFYIVVMVLCQDMYDNRLLAVDNENMNRVVETILDMHRTNLLPSYEV